MHFFGWVLWTGYRRCTDEQYEVDVLYFLGIYNIRLQRSCVENNFIFLRVKLAVHESKGFFVLVIPSLINVASSVGENKRDYIAMFAAIYKSTHGWLDPTAKCFVVRTDTSPCKMLHTCVHAIVTFNSVYTFTAWASLPSSQNIVFYKSWMTTLCFHMWEETSLLQNSEEILMCVAICSSMIWTQMLVIRCNIFFFFCCINRLRNACRHFPHL